MVETHKSRSFHGFSTDFIRNAALFTGSAEGYALGDFYQINLPFYKIYVVTDPSVMQQILIEKEKKYEKSRIYWHQLRQIIGFAMGSVEGNEWTLLKQLQKPFYTRTAAEGYLEKAERISRKHLATWATDEPIDLIEHLGALNLDIVLQTVFAIETDENPAVLAAMIAEGEAFIVWRSKFPWRPLLSKLTPTWRKTQRNLSFLSGFTKKSTQNRPLNGTANNLTDALLKNGADTTHLRNELIVHLGASTETVGVAEGWVLYLLTHHAAILQKLRAEIEQITEGGKIEFSHAHQFQFLSQVIKETMRLYPPSHAITRDCVAVEGDVLEGQKINCGDTFYISAYGLHRNPRLWDKPDVFDPDRFSPENERKIPTYAYIPFGAGKHTCIGRYLAMPMMQLTLAHIIRDFDFEIVGNSVKKPVSLSTLKPEGSLVLKLKKRTQSFI